MGALSLWFRLAFLSLLPMMQHWAWPFSLGRLPAEWLAYKESIGCGVGGCQRRAHLLGAESLQKQVPSWRAPTMAAAICGKETGGRAREITLKKRAILTRTGGPSIAGPFRAREATYRHRFRWATYPC